MPSQTANISWVFFFCLFCLFFPAYLLCFVVSRGRVSCFPGLLYSQGWPWPSDIPVSACQDVGLQAWSLCPVLRFWGSNSRSEALCQLSHIQAQWSFYSWSSLCLSIDGWASRSTLSCFYSFLWCTWVTARDKHSGQSLFSLKHFCYFLA